MPQSDIDCICGMVEGPPFDMARDGRRIIEEATSRRIQAVRIEPEELENRSTRVCEIEVRLP